MMERTMAKTGWTGEAPEPENPGGFTGFLAAQRPDPAEGRTLGEVLDRSRAGRREPDAEHRDQDAEQANLLARGYQPGGVTLLARRLADAQAELAGVQEANEKARKTQARIARDHAAGKLSAFDIAAMSFDEPDPAAEQKLERRVHSLQEQMADMSARITPAEQRDLDPVAAATSRAHQAFLDATRAALEGRPVPKASRPFVSRGAAGDVDCAECAAAGATRSESAAIHAEMAEIERGAVNPYRAEGAYDAGEIVRGTESAIVGFR